MSDETHRESEITERSNESYDATRERAPEAPEGAARRPRVPSRGLALSVLVWQEDELEPRV